MGLAFNRCVAVAVQRAWGGGSESCVVGSSVKTERRSHRNSRDAAAMSHISPETKRDAVLAARACDQGENIRRDAFLAARACDQGENISPRGRHPSLYGHSPIILRQSADALYLHTRARDTTRSPFRKVPLSPP